MLGLLLLDPRTHRLPSFLPPAFLRSFPWNTSSERVLGKHIFCVPENTFILFLYLNKILRWNWIALRIMKTLHLVSWHQSCWRVWLQSLFFHCRLFFPRYVETLGFFFLCSWACIKMWVFYLSFSGVFLIGSHLELWETFFYFVLCYFFSSICLVLLFSKTVSRMLASWSYLFYHVFRLLASWEISLFFIIWIFI